MEGTFLSQYRLFLCLCANEIMSIAEYILLFVSVAFAGLLFFIFKKPNQQTLKLTLAFSGAYLFGMCLLHLLPHLYLGADMHKIGYYILGGFIFQVILEYFSEGIEHGHIHVHKHHSKIFPLSMMLSLGLHAFIEGMPLEGNLMGHNHGHYSLLTGIILHHMPVSFALASMLFESGISKYKTIVMVLLFAAMAPVGALFSRFLSEADALMISQYFNYIMAVVIGIFLHISTTILFESNNDHRFNLYKLLTVLSGMALVILIG